MEEVIDSSVNSTSLIIEPTQPSSTQPEQQSSTTIQEDQNSQPMNEQ